MTYANVRKYPWDKWFKKLKQKTNNVLYLKRGEDYTCMTQSIYIQLRQAASHRGMKLRTQTCDDGDAIKVWEDRDA